MNKRICTYEVGTDRNFFRNLSLSGSMGCGAMLGRSFIVTKGSQEYVIFKATKEDIDSLELGSRFTEIS